MIVIYRNGRRTVIKGWRAWLLVGPAVLLVAVTMVALVCLFLGITLSVAVFFLFGLPLAIALAVMVEILQTKR